MDQPKQPRGNFAAYLNRRKQPGDRQPIFQGKLTRPDSEAERRFSLWAHEYTNPKTGEILVMYNGGTDAVAFTDAPADQIGAMIKQAAAGTMLTQGNLQLAPGQIVLFPNGFKDEQPLAPKPRPDNYGYHNPGDGTPIVRISGWLRKDRQGYVMLGGETSYPQPDKTEKEQQDSADWPYRPITLANEAAPDKKTAKKARGGEGR